MVQNLSTDIHILTYYFKHFEYSNDKVDEKIGNFFKKQKEPDEQDDHGL